MPAYWLIVERIENWKTDRGDGFIHFGIPARTLRMAKTIRRGDILLCYVSSGVSAFSDAREVISDEPQKTRYTDQYDTAYPFFLQTKPLLALPEDKWVPIKSILKELVFLSGYADWRQLFRVTIRSLPEHDGKFLTSLLNRISQDGQGSPAVTPKTKTTSP